MTLTYSAARIAACRAVGLDPDVYAHQLTGNDAVDLGADAAVIAMRRWSPAPELDSEVGAAVATHAAHAALAADRAEWLEAVSQAMTAPPPTRNQ